MRGLVALISMFFSLAAFAGAEGNSGHLLFSEGRIHAHLSWIQAPAAQSSEARMRLEWHNGITHEIMEPRSPFAVSLWMPSMGHGSAPTRIERAIDERGQVIPGVYEVSNMFFMMPGDWDVRVSLNDQDGHQETRAWSVHVAGDGHGGQSHH